MDTLVLEAPQLGGLIHICDERVGQSWNIEGCTFNASGVLCVSLQSAASTYLNINGFGNASLVSNGLYIEPLGACVEILYWILPW